MIRLRYGVAVAAACVTFASGAVSAAAQGGGGGGGGGGGKGGGGGGGGGSTPTQPAPPTLCPAYASAGAGTLPDGSPFFANEIPGVACLVARIGPDGALSIADLDVGTGWNAATKSAGGGSSNRIDVEFTSSASKDKHSIMITPGKTDIR